MAIVGAGAVGGYYGARLAEAGVDVHFLLRSDYEVIEEFGMKVESVSGNIYLPEVQCAKSSHEIGPVDLIIIAWKTTSNQYYDEVISPLLHERTMILTLQNGLGNVEELGRLFGDARIFGGLCFVCINRIGPGHLNHSASGLVRVGEYGWSGEECSERLLELIQLLKRGKIDCQPVQNLEKAQWMKLVWNVSFNGMAIAEGGVDTSVLLARPGVEARIRRIMVEVQLVAAALGHDIPDGFLESQIEATRTMGGYRPSSMIDFVNGHEVEVDAIWALPVSKARSLGVDVPEIERLLSEIELRLEQRGN